MDYNVGNKRLDTFTASTEIYPCQRCGAPLEVARFPGDITTAKENEVLKDIINKIEKCFNEQDKELIRQYVQIRMHDVAKPKNDAQ